MRPSYGDAFRFNRVLSVHFYSSNSDKILQARLVFMRYGYQLRSFKGVRDPYDEDYSLGTDQLLINALKQVREEFDVRTIFFVEDTSLRLEAFSDNEDYPGLQVKEWFSKTTFEQLDREIRLRGGDRRARIKSSIGLFLPTLSRPLFFEGISEGVVADSPPVFEASIQYPWLTPKTFNGWFIPEGSEKRLGEMEFEESLQYDFRVKSLAKLIARLEEVMAGLNLPQQFYTTRIRRVDNRGSQLSLLNENDLRIILIIGEKCAGKTTFSDYIVRRNDVLALEASTVLKELSESAGCSINSSEDAWSFLQSNGMDCVAERIGAIIPDVQSSTVVITGLRTIEEILYLIRIYPELSIVLVGADEKTRYERHIRRSRDKEIRNFKEFCDRDEDQAAFGILRVASEIADLIIRNDDGIESYQLKIDGIETALNAVSYQGKAETLSELHRSLLSLSSIGMAATCEEISQKSIILGISVRKYNTNRALKNVPEFAERIEGRRGRLLRYKITHRGEALLKLMNILVDRGKSRRRDTR